MDDAVDATIKIMQANVKDIQIRTSYNISAMDFTPEELAKEIRKHIPKFTMSYHPDFRQAIAVAGHRPSTTPMQEEIGTGINAMTSP